MQKKRETLSLMYYSRLTSVSDNLLQRQGKKIVKMTLFPDKIYYHVQQKIEAVPTRSLKEGCEWQLPSSTNGLDWRKFQSLLFNPLKGLSNLPLTGCSKHVLAARVRPGWLSGLLLWTASGLRVVYRFYLILSHWLLFFVFVFATLTLTLTLKTVAELHSLCILPYHATMYLPKIIATSNPSDVQTYLTLCKCICYQYITSLLMNLETGNALRRL